MNILKIISCIFTGAGLEFVFIRFSFPRIEEVVVNRDSEQYRETSIERDKVQVMMRINSLCGRTGNGELMLKYIKSGR